MKSSQRLSVWGLGNGVCKDSGRESLDTKQRGGLGRVIDMSGQVGCVKNISLFFHILAI